MGKQHHITPGIEITTWFRNWSKGRTHISTTLNSTIDACSPEHVNSTKVSMSPLNTVQMFYFFTTQYTSWMFYIGTDRLLK